MTPAPLPGVLETVEEEKIHRLSMAYMLLSDAIWRRSEEALERACLILREWYIDYQITPIDLAHTLTLIYSTMVPQGSSDGTSFTQAETKKLLSEVMVKIMQDVPLTGRRAHFLFEASEPLAWVSQRPNGWHAFSLYKEIMSNLLEAGVAASGITVDLVGEILSRSWAIESLVDVAFASTKGSIGKYVFVKELKSVQQAIRENPGPFVTGLFSYLQPIYDHVVVKGRVDRYPFSMWHGLYDVSLQLLAPITELLASGGLHGPAKEMGAKLWLLIPYLWMQARENIWFVDRNMGEKGFILSLEGVAEKLSFKNKKLGTALPKPLIESVRHLYLGQLRYQLKELCTDFSIARTRISEDNSAVRALVGLLAGVTILFPEETGDVVAELVEDLASGRVFSYVKPRTARKRLLTLFEHLIDQIPALYPVIVTAWPGRRQVLDKIVDTVASKILVKVV